MDLWLVISSNKNYAYLNCLLEPQEEKSFNSLLKCGHDLTNYVA